MATNPQATIVTLARYHARKAVERWVRDQGQRSRDIPLRELQAKALAWLEEHPELIAFAATRAVEMGLIKLSDFS
jgi:hypothetical protein